MFYNNTYLNNFNKQQIKYQILLKYWASIRVNYLYLILCFSLLSNLAVAQCSDSGNYWNNSWVSCNISPNPNSVRPNSHWVLYEFHQPENISESHIWNANRIGESETGAREVFIDYSVDGSTWVELGTYTFPQAGENEDYTGFEGPDFGGIFVQKILITILNTHGDGACASIAEAQFKINPDACYGTIDECGQCNGSGISTWYIDADGDGLGHIDTSVQDCNQPAGYVANPDDYCDNGLLGWNEVSAIFSDNGCTSCHGDNALGGLNLLSYETAVTGGNKCGTNILTGTTLTDIITINGYDECGAPIGIPSMNQRVGGQIDANELALLQTWIDSGALEDCNCRLGEIDADQDGTCNAIDECPNFDNRLIGTPCDDGIICTENDVWTNDCDCKGQLSTDSDSDGVCDIEDTAPNDPCTADGIIDGVEPAAWLALPTNDCDTDGVNNTNGDLNDFAPCIDNQGQISTAACNCPTNMVLAGGRMVEQNGMSPQAGFADGLPDGKMSGSLKSNDNLYLSFPYMPAGEEICITLGFEDINGIVNFNLNDNSFTYLNFSGLDNYQPQEICFKTLTEGEQTVIIKEIGVGDIIVDGSTYSYCPCNVSDPKYASPYCDCIYDSTNESGAYLSAVGINNSERADGAPDGNLTNLLGYLDILNLTFPNITPGGEICVTLGFGDKDGLARFDFGGESAFFPNLTQDTLFTPQEFCFINKSGNPNVAITQISSGIKVDGSYYNYCPDCPTDNNGNTPIKAELHTWLEGNYDPALREMTTALNTRGLLPGQTPTNDLATATPAGQPYHTAPWNHTGTEGITWDNSYYTDIESDWVLVSFRTGIAKNTEVTSTAALLNRDGSIRFAERCALPYSDGTPLYVVVEHRNHIGIMSREPISIEGNILKYDFRRGDSYRDETSFGQKQLPTGEWVMFAGDGDQIPDILSYDITGADKRIWADNNGVFDYYLSPDFNLDGDVNGGDKTLWFENNGVSSRVPK